MGGAIALHIAADKEFEGLIERLILDSPVLDWYATIAANCARVGLPSQAGVLARPWLEWGPLARVVGLRSSIALDHFDWISRAEALPVPTLIHHGTEDTSSPPAAARRLAVRSWETVLLHLFHADHTLAWNSDPERWSRHARDWLRGSRSPSVNVAAIGD